MWLNGLLIVILLVCVYTDVKRRKIYNKLIFPALFVAIFSHLFFEGVTGFEHSLTGLVVGLAILIIPYFLGGIGAGDVKLLGLIGAIKGATFVIQTSIYMALIGAVIALCVLLFGKGRFQALVLFLFNRLVGVKTPLLLDQSKKWFPYGVAIAGGAFVGLILQGTFLPW